jgi:hypothetical protein
VQENTMGNRGNAKLGQLLRTCELDPSNDSNEIGQHKKCATDATEHAKIGQLCELDPDQVSNQIGQKKVQNFFKLLPIFSKFREINLISYFAK